jgi:hypothetical protein
LHSRTDTFSPAIARSAISVAVINSPIVAFNDCSSFRNSFSRLFSITQ